MAFLLFLSLTLTALLFCQMLFIRKTLREIGDQMEQILQGDTNAVIRISSRDKTLRTFAAKLNANLRSLRDAKCAVERKSNKLTNAITAVSHDLRTPLTAICGYIGLLEAEDASVAAKGYIKMIKNRADALKKLTEELFQYSVLFSAEKEPRFEEVSLNAALEESFAQFYGAMSKSGVSPNIEMPDSAVIRLLNKDYLARIFSNILSNAIRYSSGDFDVVLYPDGKISFSNSAPELDAVTAARLFERFYTVSNGKGSTGLGLAVAKNLTEEMGGTICSVFERGRLTIEICFY